MERQMPHPADWIFRRRFALTMFKNQKLPLAEMCFLRDFTQIERGDLYPVLSADDACTESVFRGRWNVNGSVSRLLGQFFPYATCSVTVDELVGMAGFCLILPQAEAKIALMADENGSAVVFFCGQESAQIAIDRAFETMLVSCRPGAFDIYLCDNSCSAPVYAGTFSSEAFRDTDRESVFAHSRVAVFVNGSASVRAACMYLDCGIAQADPRPIRCENGEILQEDGKVWLTMSVRLHAHCFQGVFSWVPGTSELTFTGALFFAANDDKWGNDVASSVLWHRTEHRWYLWVCSFCRGHVLGHAIIDGEIRRGVNVVDIALMDPPKPDEDATAFAAFSADEDPDFYYDEEHACWYMAICRRDPETSRYRYFFFRSAEPFSGYTFLGKGLPGSETGGSFVRIGRQRYFVCGNSFELHSDYRIYDENGMRNAKFDHPDGGFRGWGTLMPLKLGTRVRYFWLTFDRQLGSDFNWSYGNLYCFEADSYSDYR